MGVAAPSRLETIDPNCGQPPAGFALRVSRPWNTWAASWSAWLPTSERIRVYLSAILASPGKASQISIPGTFVRTGRQGPANSRGAWGLRSNMSWWGGPPTR